jgi:hypothetical protein
MITEEGVPLEPLVVVDVYLLNPLTVKVAVFLKPSEL